MEENSRIRTSNKTNWKSLVGPYGPLANETLAGTIAHLATPMGCIARGSHVPVVWKATKKITQSLGKSIGTFRARIKLLTSKGLLFPILLHGRPGRTQIYIAKFPDQTRKSALLCAWVAVNAFLKVPVDVRFAIEYELQLLGYCDEQLYELLDPPTITEEPSPHIPESKRAKNECLKTQNLSLQSIIYNNKTNIEIEGGTPTSKKASSKDLLASKTLFEFLSGTLKVLKIRCSTSQLQIINDLYSQYADTRGFRLTLLAKIQRLAEKYRSSALQYLIKDADDLDSRKAPLPSTYITPIVLKGEAPEIPSQLSEWWEGVKHRLKDSVSDHVYQSWFRNMIPRSKTQNHVVLEFADEFFRDYVAQNYGDVLRRSLGSEHIELSYRRIEQKCGLTGNAS